MKTKLIESAEWIAAYTLDYVGKVTLGLGMMVLCFATLLI